MLKVKVSQKILVETYVEEITEDYGNKDDESEIEQKEIENICQQEIKTNGNVLKRMLRYLQVS